MYDLPLCSRDSYAAQLQQEVVLQQSNWRDVKSGNLGHEKLSISHEIESSTLQKNKLYPHPDANKVLTLNDGCISRSWDYFAEMGNLEHTIFERWDCLNVNKRRDDTIDIQDLHPWQNNLQSYQYVHLEEDITVDS